MTSNRIPGPPCAPPLPLLFAITVTGILANTVIAPAIPEIVDDFGISDAGAGLVVTAAALPGIVVAPAIGFLADRFGRKAVLVPCLVVFGLSGGLAAMAPDFRTLLVLRFLQGIGGAGLLNLAVVLIGDHWEGIERARVIGRNAAVLTAALAVMPLLGGGLTEAFGWRASFLPYLLALVTAVLAARRLPGGRRLDSRPIDQLREALPILTSRRVVSTLATGFAAFLLIFGLFLTVLPVHLEEEFGVGAGRRGIVLGLPALTSTTAALLLGRLRSRWSARFLGAVSFALFTVAFGIVADAGALPVLVAGILVYGMGEGILIPTLQDNASELAPPASRGAVVAAWVGAARAGQSIGPVAAGAVLGAAGGGTAFGVGAVLAAGLLLAQVVGRQDP